MNKVVYLLLIAIYGCTPIMNASDMAHYDKVSKVPIYCNNNDECELKWGRAILWISENSHWKIRNQTDNLITTEGPFDTTYVAYIVNKVPLGDGAYQIKIQAGCGNIFGCIPSDIELKSQFVEFVNQQYFEKYRLYDTTYTNEPIDLTPVDKSEIHNIGEKELFVIYDSINIYAEPKFSQNIVSTSHKSNKLIAIAENVNWFKIKIDQEKFGWVSKNWVNESQPTAVQ